ncbi:MAG: hypothetical protein O3A00_11895 [Planctomycetota bacterium]|nr:hypothetical protein [Planctomycetota bacterium]
MSDLPTALGGARWRWREKGAAAFALAGALIPGGANKAAKHGSGIIGKVGAGFKGAGKSISRHTACNAPTKLGRGVGKVLGRCFTGDTLVIMDYADVPAVSEIAAFGFADLPSNNETPGDGWARGLGITCLVIGGLGSVRQQRKPHREREMQMHDQLFADRALPDLLTKVGESRGVGFQPAINDGGKLDAVAAVVANRSTDSRNDLESGADVVPMGGRGELSGYAPLAADSTTSSSHTPRRIIAPSTFNAVFGVEPMAASIGGHDSLAGEAGDDLLYCQFGDDTFLFTGSSLGADWLARPVGHCG